MQPLDFWYRANDKSSAVQLILCKWQSIDFAVFPAQVFVAEDNKDEKYWQRRKKNNVAAKRSRDARRIKENQIAMRAAFLEKQNETLKEELDKLKQNNMELQKRLAKYEPDGALP